MAHEKISDEEILRRADAIKELQRIKDAKVNPVQTIQLVLPSRQPTNISTYKAPHTPLSSSFVEIAAEIFLPFLEKGLEEYRKRIDAISDGKG